MAAVGTHAASDVPEIGSGRKPLGTLLVGAGLMTEAQLDEALQEGAATGQRLGEIVVGRGWATEDDVAKLLAEQWELGYVERASIFFDSDALGRLSREQAQRLEALPTRVQDGRVVVAVAEPTEERLAALREVIGPETVVVVVPKTALDAGLRSELLSGPGTDPPPPRPEPTPAGESPPAAAEGASPLPPPVPQPVAQPSSDVRELDAVLAALAAAAAEAASLGRSMSALSARLSALVEDANAAADRLSGGAQHARIEQLERQLSQRTELTESLKQQLAALSRTLDTI